jgi:hypothetical protein
MNRDLEKFLAGKVNDYKIMLEKVYIDKIPKEKIKLVNSFYPYIIDNFNNIKSIEDIDKKYDEIFK